MLAATAWTVDGSPIMTRGHAEKVCALRALEALDPQVPAAGAPKLLRTLLDASRQIAADEPAAELRLRREVVTGAPATTSVRRVVRRFNRWLVAMPEMRMYW